MDTDPGLPGSRWYVTPGGGIDPVSYTHLDVYKRQVVGWLGGLESWASYARQAGQPLPDLIASYTQPTASQA